MWQILIAGLLSARCYAQLWIDSLEIRQGVWPGDGARAQPSSRQSLGRTQVLGESLGLVVELGQMLGVGAGPIARR